MLMGATMPAVLVELGFISNPEEEKKLQDPAYRDQLVDALVRAVARYKALVENRPDPAPPPRRRPRRPPRLRLAGQPAPRPAPSGQARRAGRPPARSAADPHEPAARRASSWGSRWRCSLGGGALVVALRARARAPAAGRAAERRGRRPGERGRASTSTSRPTAAGCAPSRASCRSPRRPRTASARSCEALLAGPKAPGLARPFPEGVVLGGVLLGRDGTAYVDLRWPDHDGSAGRRLDRGDPAGLQRGRLGRAQRPPGPARRAALERRPAARPSRGHLDLCRPARPGPRRWPAAEPRRLPMHGRHRGLRLGSRRADRGLGPAPAAAGGIDPLPGRHGAPALRQQVARHGHPLHPAQHRVPHRARRQGGGGGLQHGFGAGAAPPRPARRADLGSDRAGARARRRR